MDQNRIKRLHIFFNKVLEGKQQLITTTNAKSFIEAITTQRDAVACAWRLADSPKGSAALQQALRIDTSREFFNNHACLVLRYLLSDEVSAVAGGDLLHRILDCIVSPQIFWNQYIQALESDQLDSNSVHCFAWLLYRLLSFDFSGTSAFIRTASSSSVQKILANSSQPETRNVLQKINRIIRTAQISSTNRDDGPGGRHDNDFEDFRRITIMPTVDELVCTDKPFIRLAAEIDTETKTSRLSTHLDNQFRLLREDLIRELREELQSKLTNGSKKSRGQLVENLRMHGVDLNGMRKWALVFELPTDLPFLPNGDEPKRKKFLQENRKIFPHESLTALLADDKLVGLGLLSRNEDLIAQNPPKLCVNLSHGETATKRTLSDLRTAKNIKMIQLNTATFAYTPILQQLQSIKMVPIADELVNWTSDDGIACLGSAYSTEMQKLSESMIRKPSQDLKIKLDLPKPAILDASQARSFVAGLTQKVSLIQGPPGTGKSFIGALVLKAIFSLTKKKILVVCYTNHALDQFTEDLLDIGVPSKDIVRLGSPKKATACTEKLALFQQQQTSAYRMTPGEWNHIEQKRSEATLQGAKLQKLFMSYNAPSVKKSELLEYLEFPPEYSHFYDAFMIPENEGFQLMGKNSKRLDPGYLLNQWATKRDAGVLKRLVQPQHEEIWQLNNSERDRLLAKWRADILEERVEQLIDCGISYDKTVCDVTHIQGEKGRRVMRDRRIICCTTTAAAKYVKDIQSASPDIVIVEEAGEILESHILTAIGPSTEQLVLIGDHKQLRPKSHYKLSVEEGTGYDLNRSLFERLVLKGYRHETLSLQHRMRPEISYLVRSLTYPELMDAPTTMKRSDLRGFQDNVIFVNHNISEDEVKNAYDPREGGSTSSKQNRFEADMVLKTVRYLAQQGYRSDQIVVITPYLGQLRLLYDVLKEQNDPVLNDMDSYDLVRAGLMPSGTAQLQKPRLRISTIDNYQGEESDVVVVSLTRSNTKNDIGFLQSPERLNVLLSRARDGLIMIGNAAMFLLARSGKDLWAKLIGLLKSGSHIYEGFPIRCMRHPKCEALITLADEFDRVSPDGGCSQPCDAILNCNLHSCPQKCHQLSDHSKMKCMKNMTGSCTEGHTQRWLCFELKPVVCSRCERERKAKERQQKVDLDRQQELDTARRVHDDEMRKIQDEIDRINLEIQSKNAKADMKLALEQKKLDLESMRTLVESTNKPQLSIKHSDQDQDVLSTQVNKKQSLQTINDDTKSDLPTSVKENRSSAEITWKHIKNLENITNNALDNLMIMTGLEEVKSQFITILQKVCISQRQGLSLSSERLGAVLLGNPGTGKTTVARLYSQYLVSLGVLPGSQIVETTGASLANDGVAGAKKMLTDMMKDGGGTIFIDEAYQLASGAHFSGGAVLDFLLAEIENTTGKIVFIFAGYTQQMEKFFQHNPGFDSRLPHRFRFPDYTETELISMFERKVNQKYKGRMKIESGLKGIYVRIAVKRLHQGSGKEGFGNARALENMLNCIAAAQSSRVGKERLAGEEFDDNMFTQEDLIGPEPSTAFNASPSWRKLREMIGLEAVKREVQNLIDRISLNYRRELEEKPVIEVGLNRLFLGSPGTGKTTVANLYAQILADLGLLSSGEVASKTPSDFIGSALGDSEKKTKAILDTTKGKVLVIDEAYMLCSTSVGGVNGSTDPYRTAVVDTLVSQVHNTPGDDRAVLLLGYKEQMEELLRKSNPGLARRFPLDDAFHFEDYNDDQLLEILDMKLAKAGLSASSMAKKVAIDLLVKARRRPNFGNAGEVENLLSRVKSNNQKRLHGLPLSQRCGDVLLEPEDFDPDFDRNMNSVENCRLLFKDVVGCEDVVEKLEGYVQTAQNMRSMGIAAEDHIPFNFLFKGPPGTGKTTTARKIGQIFYDMGFLASNVVIECSATDLVGQYVGQTGPKVTQKLDEALGRVLFIDEAYRLAEGQFAKEAIDELVDSLTKVRYHNKLIVVLAGYDDEINVLLTVNPGLSSRFPEEIIFENLDPQNCLELLLQRIRRVHGVPIEVELQPEDVDQMRNKFAHLTKVSGWANGRDIETIAKRVTTQVFKNPPNPTTKIFKVNGVVLLKELGGFYSERLARLTSSSRPSKVSQSSQLDPQFQHTTQPPSIRTECTITTEKIAKPKQITPSKPSTVEEFTDIRDDNVSDAIWAQLTADKKLQVQIEAQYQAEINKAQIMTQQAASEAKKRTKQLQDLETIVRQKKNQEDDEARRRHEQMRLEALAALRKAQEEEERFRKIKEQVELERKREQQAQQKLREMGVCCAGYRWIKQSNGYRCAGGSHFISDHELGM